MYIYTCTNVSTPVIRSINFEGAVKQVTVIQTKDYPLDTEGKLQSKYFVGNTQTGGYGITLTAASNVIYYSNSYDLEKRLQSEDRAHRIGQHKPVTYVDLIAEKTVDEKIIKALRKKINIASTVMGDKVQEWI